MTRIRKSPSMTGSFAEVAQEFIQYKRSTGFKYADEPKCLSRFCRFSEEQGVTEIKISRSLAEKWTAPRAGESEKSRSHRITCIRQFAIYLNNLGYDAYIVPEVKGSSFLSGFPPAARSSQTKAYRYSLTDIPRAEAAAFIFSFSPFGIVKYILS